MTLDQCRWIVGGSDQPLPPFDYIPQLHPANVEVTRAAEGKALGQMLEAGEIDAFIGALAPQGALNDSPQVARLFPEYVSVERDYYRCTGIFPIMHTLVVRRELVAQHPGLAQAIYRGYCDAKDVATELYRKDRVEQHIVTMIPWFSQLFDENRRLFPDDWWSYGVEANRKAIDAFLRYHFVA